MRITRRRVIVSAAVVAAAAGIVYLMRPKPIEVETAFASRGPMRATVDAEGRTSVRDRYAVAAPVTGRLRRIALHEGDAITAAQVVAWIAPMPLDAPSRQQGQARLLGAQAALREAEVRLGQARVAEADAKKVADRREVVFRAGAISQEELERMRLAHAARVDDLAAAEARVRAASAEVDAARAALLGASGRAPEVAVRAPARGRVLRIPEASERIVAAGTPLIEIGDESSLEITADVLSSDAVKLAAGDFAEIDEWGGGRPLRARVRSIEPSAFTRVSALGVDEQRVNVTLDLLESPPALGDNFRVEVRVTVWESADALTIPASAVFGRDGRWSVFIVENGRARMRAVELGHRTAATVEVLDGLDAGARVILFPSDQIAEATRVSPARG